MRNDFYLSWRIFRNGVYIVLVIDGIYDSVLQFLPAITWKILILIRSALFVKFVEFTEEQFVRHEIQPYTQT